MKSLISFLFAVVFVSAAVFGLTSCTEGPGTVYEPDDPDKGNEKDDPASIKIPDFKDYGRGTVDFAKMTYSRPDFNSAILQLDSLTDIINKNELSYQMQLNKIKSIEHIYINVSSMASLSNIYAEKNKSDLYWSSEYAYISTNYPRFSQSLEKLFIACANSTYAQEFERDFFGKGFVQKYKDGGIYSDKVVALLSEEAKYEAEYSAISKSTVNITYSGITDTYDNIISYYRDKYGSNSFEFAAILTYCEELYKIAAYEKSAQILVDLVKVRRLISDEFGYESYTDFAYDAIYHDYTKEEMTAFISNTRRYVVPVYVRLMSLVFNQFENTMLPSDLDTPTLINTVYETLEEYDGDMSEVFSYMLQHNLYDIGSSSDDRSDLSFTTYIDSYNAPYLFITTEGNINDYLTLMHEFGHFQDFYVNYGEQTSIDLSEVSSQGFEFLMLTKLKDNISEKDYRYLKYSQLKNSLEILVYQSFYAAFEHNIYELSYEAITLDNLNRQVSKAAKDIGFSPDFYSDLRYVMIPHIYLYPCYVQSYSTSATVALELYFMEKENQGSGFEAYKKLIDRDDSTLSFEAQLESASLTSPFEKDFLKEIADMIHYDILGAHYYTTSNNQNAA